MFLVEHGLMKACYIVPPVGKFVLVALCWRGTLINVMNVSHGRLFWISSKACVGCEMMTAGGIGIISDTNRNRWKRKHPVKNSSAGIL